MPPVYKKITPIQVFDGLEPVDFTKFGLNAKYQPNVVPAEHGTKIFDFMNSADSPLKDHTYVGNFNRIITPARKVHASVPERSFYRFKGKDIVPIISESYNKLIDELKSSYMPPEFQSNSSISNLYRYNGKDCIAPHTDDEKFLGIGNYEEFPDVSTVATFTFLADTQPMLYLVGDPNTGKGYGIKLQHGSVMFQGNVLHEVPPVYSKGGEAGRLSVTLRQLDDSCPCKKISCPWTAGPSNYLYYTGSYVLKSASTSATSATSVTLTIAPTQAVTTPIPPKPVLEPPVVKKKIIIGKIILKKKAEPKTD
jgi:hypothetical protein